MNDDEPLVRMRDLRKWFSGIPAIDGVNLELRRGEIVGLIGRNGSGKSTLLRHIPGLLLPDAGSCTTFGREARDLGSTELARLGYVDQEGELLPYLRVYRHIDYVRAYYPRWNDEVQRAYLERFPLPLEERVGALSPGVRQQLAVLLAIGFEPELLVLDEAAASMDPIARAELLDLLAEMIQDGDRCIVIASHILSDVEKVVDRIVMLHDGEIIRDASLDGLRDAYRVVRLTAVDRPLPADLPVPGVVESKRSGDTVVLTVRDASHDALSAVARLGCRVDVMPVPLDDIYRLEVACREAGL
jgi:ABC-2 type transport system ATP-binding protein